MCKFSAKIGVAALSLVITFGSLAGTAQAQMGGPPPGPPPGGGGGGGGDVVTVVCPGDSLQAALDEAKEGDTFNVSGTCNERITVIIGNVTIDGLGAAIIDGTGLSAPGSLLRVQALNVRILNLTVQNGPRSGIQVRRGGSAFIQGVTSTGHVSNGILINTTAYARIGPGSAFHPTAGDPPGNHIFNNRSGISVRSGANADIFHNLITGNLRGIGISNNGSADIDANVITGNTSSGLSLSNNGAVRLSSDSNHHDTVGDGAPVTDDENNLIEKNGEGLRCRRGGAADGNLQNFGVGNPGPQLVGEPPEDPDPTDDHDDDALIADDCHVRDTVFE